MDLASTVTYIYDVYFKQSVDLKTIQDKLNNRPRKRYNY